MSTDRIQQRAEYRGPSAPFELRVIDHVFDQAVISAAYDVFRHLTLPEGVLFLHRAELVGGDAPPKIADAMPAPIFALIGALIDRIEAFAPARIIGAGGGYEVWLGKTFHPGGGAFLHVDNDEQIRRRTGQLISPTLGAILHLGPCGLVGGETLFEMKAAYGAGAPALFESHPWPDLVKMLVAPRVIAQKPGRLILFPGDAPHAVAPLAAAPPGPRVALLANYWARPPRAAGAGALSPAALRSLLFASN